MTVNSNYYQYVEQLFAHYYKDLEKECMRYLKYDRKFFSLIDECIQEAFVKAMLNCEELHSHENALGWLVECCHNYLKSELRKYRYRGEIVKALMDKGEAARAANMLGGIERWINQHDAKSDLETIQRVLTALDSQVFDDYFVKGLSMKQTVTKNRLSQNSVRGAIERIRKKAVRYLKVVIFIFFG